MIPKGTKVLLKTTNGGVAEAMLVENYKPTYDVVVAIGAGGWARVSALRIKSVTPLKK